MKNDKSKIHAGHRQRLKDKVRQNGLKSLSTHEVLELLLTYSIPYKDTNELAHNLINSFGSIANVFGASYEELLNFNGVGEETALFLSTIPEYFEIYKAHKHKNENIINTTSECIKYFRNNVEIKKNEHLYLICLSPTNKVIRFIDVGGINSFSVSVDIKYVAEKIVNIGASSIIMCHTHPNGNVTPSEEDHISTSRILGVCYMLGIAVYDHIVFNEINHYSYGSNGKLQELSDNICETMRHIMPLDKFSKGKTSFAQKTNSFKYDK